jgi:hypothetical protein
MRYYSYHKNRTVVDNVVKGGRRCIEIITNYRGPCKLLQVMVLCLISPRSISFETLSPP